MHALRISLRSAILAVGGLLATSAVTAQDNTLIIETRVDDERYREVEGEWIDSPEKSQAEDVTAGVGSRKLVNPSANLTATVEFLPGSIDSERVQVSVTWPVEANAAGLVIELIDSPTPQLFPIRMEAEGADDWNLAGIFDLGQEAPVFRVSTTEALEAADTGRPLNVLLDAVRFIPLEGTKDPFAAIVSEATAEQVPPEEIAEATEGDPFADVVEVTQPAEPPAELPTEDSPFADSSSEAAPVAPQDSQSPFVDSTQADTTVASEETSPFDVGTEQPVDPFAASPPAEETVTEPFAAVQAPEDVEPQDPFSQPAVETAQVEGESPFVGQPGETTDPFADSMQSPMMAETTADPFAQSPMTAEPTSDPFAATTQAPMTPDAMSDPFTDTMTAEPTSDPFADTMTADSATDPFADTMEIPTVSVTPTDPFAGESGQTVPDVNLDTSTPIEVASAQLSIADMPPFSEPNTPGRSLAYSLITADSSYFASAGLPPARASIYKRVEITDASSSRTDANGRIRIDWAPSFEDARRLATERETRIIVVFLADNPASQQFENEILSNPRVAEALNRGVPVKVDRSEAATLAKRFNVSEAPYTVVLNRHGFTVAHIVEKRSSQVYLEELLKVFL